MGIRIGSIKPRFALFVLLFTLAIVWCGAGFFSHLLREEMIQQAGKQQYSTVSTLADTINGELIGRLGALEAVAKALRAETMAAPATLQAYLEGQPILGNLFSGGTRVLRPDGSVLASIPHNPEDLAANYADRDYLVNALKEGRPTIGRPVIGKVLKVPVLGLAAPIRDTQGRIVAVLVGAIEINRSTLFDRVVSSPYGRSGGYGLFIPHDRSLLTAVDGPLAIRPAPTPGINRMLDRYMQGYEGYGLTITSLGVEELSAARGIPVAGWFLVGRIPSAEAFAPIRAMQTRVVYAALLASLLAGLLAWWWVAFLLRREFRPMLMATDAIEAMAASGETIAPLPVYGDDEIGKLIAGFNTLLAGIGERQAELRRAQQETATVNDHLSELVATRTAELTARTDELETIVDTASSGIALVQERTFVLGNRRLHEMFGWPPGEMIGKSTAIWYPDEQAFLEVGRTLYAHIWSGEVDRRELELMRRDGSRFWARMSAAAVDPADLSKGVVAVIDDITAERETLAAISSARAQAEAANVAKSAFLANMSHEIRTPMNAISGLVHLLRRDRVTAQQAERLAKIDASSRHLLSIINDILDMSKIEAGKLSLETVDFALEQVLDQTASIVGEAARAKALSVTVDRDHVPVWLRGDVLRIRQALLNFASNAVKFTERGGITLRAELLDDQPERIKIRFSVEDTGVGVAAEHQERLFHEFEQGDSATTRKYGGTGLGLAITKRLAGLMGGEVGCDSTPGAGSRFWFTAWLQRGHGVMPAVDRRPSTAESDLRDGHAGGRVLLAEDNAINAEVALELLHGVNLWVDVAENGRVAVEKARIGTYEIVLMDMQMPEMDGLAACRALRALPQYAAVPVLAMTANAFEEDRAACLAAGMNDFIAKPVDPDALYAMLLKWLPEQAAAPNEPPPGATAASVPGASTELILTRLAETPGVDLARGLRMLRDRKDKYVDLLRCFHRANAEDLASIRGGVAAGDLATAQRTVHSLKSAAGNLGLDALHEVARELDESLRQAAPERERLMALIDRLEDRAHDLVVILASG